MTRSRITWISTLAVTLLSGVLAAAPAARADDTPPAEPSPASAEMLKSMREKGILTEEEYEDLYRRQAMYEKKAHDDAAIPGWLDNWSVGGDLRLRLERQDWREPVVVPELGLTPGVDNVDLNRSRAIDRRDRARIRLRIGAEKQLMEGLDVGFRIVTSQGTTYGVQNGSNTADFRTTLLSDPRSSNVTLGDDFAPKSIFLDRAYVRWSPWFARDLALSGGIVPNPFLSGNFPDMVIWDPDINPQGASATYHFDFMPEYLWSDTRAGAFVISEVGEVNIDTSSGVAPFFSTVPTLDEHDPYMYGVQQEITAQPMPWLRMGVRASYYDLKNLNTQFAAATMDLGNFDTAISHNPLNILLTPGVEGFSNGRSNGRMQEIVVDGYFTWNGLGDRWQVTPFAQWSFLPNADGQDQTLSLGATFGDANFLKVTVMYSRVEANGTVALFTDSDLFDGFTNAKGWYVSAERKLTKSIRLRAAYMDSKIVQPLCTSTISTPLAPNQLALCNNGVFTRNPTDFEQAFTTNLSRYRVQLDLIADF